MVLHPSQEFADANFEMYSKTLRGVTEQRARWKRGVDMTNAVLGESLAQVCRKTFPA